MKLFNLKILAVETTCLLLSSFACGMASIASNARSMLWTQIGYLATGALGATFLGLGDQREFSRMLTIGAGPDRSAFCPRSSRWSAFMASMWRSVSCGSER